MARNIPPTIKRKSFGFMNHKDYDHSLWGKLKAKSLEGINDNQPTIMGFDNFNEMIIASRTNINNILELTITKSSSLMALAFWKYSKCPLCIGLK